MKTTIDIADDLLLRAKELAKEENITLRSLIEKSLIEVLDKKEVKQEKIDLPSFKGEGINPTYEAMSWNEKLEVIYGNGSDRL